jgi:hypothetical protein
LMSAHVKGFGCRPHEGQRGVFGGRRPKASKGDAMGRAATVEEYGIIGADVNRWSTPCRS